MPLINAAAKVIIICVKEIFIILYIIQHNEC